MGAEWSAPPGRADVPTGLLPFTVWTKHDLQMMRRRHAVSLGGVLALKQEHFAKLLCLNYGTADLIFETIFDTDCNGLVDTFETMCAMALLCSAPLVDKVNFAHSLFDFSCQGDLSLAEVTLLLRTALVASQKLDGIVDVPTTDALEEFCLTIFDQHKLDHESNLPKHQFDAFAFGDRQITAFLQRWSGSMSQVLIAEGTQWEDPDFPADESSLGLRPGIVVPGMPTSEAVHWLRPFEIAKGDVVVLFVGDVPGEGRILPGQLADQWLLSAMGILTGQPNLLRSLFVPTGQEEKGRYCIKIFKEANWTNVFVDTRVPCDSTGNVLFSRGRERHELWTILLEKAFAKAHGCYENIMHGETCEALRDLTGGVAEKLQWSLPMSDAAQSTLAMSEPPQSLPHDVGVARIGGEPRGGTVRPRLAGWGLPLGSTRAYGWIFDAVRTRLAEGHIVGCSRQVWHRDPWESDHAEEGKEQDHTDAGGAFVDGLGPQTRRSTAVDGFLFPPSNRVMRGLRVGVSYCILEMFERADVRLLRLKDPWSGEHEYQGNWGPSSPLWSTRPALASELLPRTLSGTFWMDQPTFVQIFNTLYAVDVSSEGDHDDDKRSLSRAADQKGAKGSVAAAAAAEKREGRLEGLWEGEQCGGRFTAGKGWLQGTQAFLFIDPAGTVTDGSSTSAALKRMKNTALEEDDGEEGVKVSITVTQEDSRYHGRDFSEREERKRSVGFLVHTHKWSLESKRNIPKLSQILQKDTKHVTRPFLPKRDVSCRISLPPGQYVVVATTLEPGGPGRFWVHIKADRNFTLQPSSPAAAMAGPSAGRCDLKLEELGLPESLAYNEAEEDAAKKDLTATAATVAALWTSAQDLALRKALLETQLYHLAEGESAITNTSTIEHNTTDDTRSAGEKASAASDSSDPGDRKPRKNNTNNGDDSAAIAEEINSGIRREKTATEG